MKKIYIAALLSALAGCEKYDIRTKIDVPVQSAAAVALTPPPKATPEDWKKALESTYVATSVKDEGDGKVSFFACFSQLEPKKCASYSFASKDAFRKRRFFEAGLYSSRNIGTYIPSYISIGDNERPLLLLAPYFFGKNGWIFMNKVSILLEGDIILEKDFEELKIDRNAKNYGVEEQVNFIASEEQIFALRKIKAESKLLIRLTGSKGYVNLKKEDIEHFKGEIANLLFIYDKINLALDGNIPIEDVTTKK